MKNKIEVVITNIGILVDSLDEIINDTEVITNITGIENRKELKRKAQHLSQLLEPITGTFKNKLNDN